MQLIKNWSELAQVPANDKYKIVVDEDMGSAWIRPVKETEETEKNWFDHNQYLSTHTFYGDYCEWSTELLQRFGFDIIIDNWDKEVNNE